MADHTERDREQHHLDRVEEQGLDRHGHILGGEIERIYHITERAERVTWSKMNIHADFVEKFLEIHKVKNLRTLEKAQRFFEDVKLFCNSDMSEQFKEELRLICFAVVVESIENLYYKEIDSDNTDSVEKMTNTIGNMLQHRIGRYLYGIKCSTNLVEMILKYYEEGVLNEEQLEAEYKLFLNSGDKPNYYYCFQHIRNTRGIVQDICHLRHKRGIHLVRIDSD